LGTLAFLLAIPTAFTGYLLLGDFYSQWNAVQAKDGLNALGLAWFNVLNAGQMYGFHAMVLPFFLAIIIGLHIAFIRIRGVVPPYPSLAERLDNERTEEERRRVPSED
jgi:ubiquinol-cytochrome c reductase cytochrome b subunit